MATPATILKHEKKLTIRGQAKTILSEVDGDIERAEKIFKERVSQSLFMRNELMEWAVHNIFLNVMELGRGTVTGKTIDPNIKPNPDAGIAGLKAQGTKNFYQFALKGGLKLGEAYANDVRNQQEIYKKQTLTFVTRLAFLEFVVKEMKYPKKKVKNQITEARLAELYLKATGDAFTMVQV